MRPDTNVLVLLLGRAEEQIETLKLENARLRKALTPDPPVFAHALGLTRAESYVLRELLTSAVITYDRVLAVMPVVWGDKRSDKNVTVHISKLRKKLAAYDVEIRNVHRIGYRIDREHRIRLQTELDMLADTEVGEVAA